MNRRVIFFSAVSFSSQVIFNIKFYVLSDQHYLYHRYRLFPIRTIRSHFTLRAHFSYFCRVISSATSVIRHHNVLSLYILLEDKPYSLRGHCLISFYYYINICHRLNGPKAFPQSSRHIFKCFFI